MLWTQLLQVIPPTDIVTSASPPSRLLTSSRTEQGKPSLLISAEILAG